MLLLWLLVGSAFLSAFCVLSREALGAFSFSEAEEHLRKTGRAKRDLPRLERFAEHIRDHQFGFRMVDYACRAVTMVALWELIIGWPGLQAQPAVAVAVFGAGFVVHLIALDLVLRPLADAHAETVTLVLLRPWQVFGALTWLPLLPLRGLFELMRRLVLGTDGQEDANAQAEEDIMAVVSQGEYTGQIDEEERDMIESVLGLGDQSVDKVMTPRTDMHAVDLEDGCEGVLREAQVTGHSRLPVYEDNRDNIVGVCYVKDLLGHPPDDLPPLRSILRMPLFVPESKNVGELMRDLRRERIHLAIVLDEYGGTAGLITVEDIIEEVFGEIDDEYDTVSVEEVQRSEDGTVELDARMHVDEVNERFNVNLPESERYESLGGLLTSCLGCIPETGMVWEADRLRLTVLEATDRRVVRIQLEDLERIGMAQSA